ncbi:hypothetical protein VST7929_01497 [Vibrio stylophorae]|uniref:HTH arsR-type domain-containing protein n=1 Tax=Vibrio stylophorae TaxID=659351 RepID=A0ABN8DR41_9VIBR|nr:winged helix-turn-helix domain-containing protein [Vibrio stylophorae]CAH0533626.1 hypothetical protein VST7929_01497 [Vibrio stylophorae]
MKMQNTELDCQPCSLPQPSAAHKVQIQQLAETAKALSHPARVQILTHLLALHQAGGCLNSDLVGQLGLAQSTVSEHLRILKKAGLIEATPMPPRTCYRLAPQALVEFQQLFAALFALKPNSKPNCK